MLFRGSSGEITMAGFGVLIALCAALSVGAVLAGTGSTSAEMPTGQQEVTAGGSETPMILGTQTHFSQGWSENTLARARTVGAPLLRDSHSWGMTERSPGRYDFSGETGRKLSRACNSGFRLILTAEPRNPNYDDGQWAFTDRANTAFADYLSAVAEHWGDCIAAFEIGNEINGGPGLKYPGAISPTEGYLATLRMVDQRHRSQYPKIAILGGSTNMIGTGFLTGLFKAGMLDLVDGVAVHQYKAHGESTDVEIANLRGKMRTAGRVLPIWVTEFSHDVTDEDEAARQFLKTTTQLAESGAAVTVWYALIDQRWFPNMGLFQDTRIKPTGEAFRFAQKELIPRGRPVRIELGDPSVFAYKYGADRLVLWALGQVVQISPTARLFDATGESIPNSGTLEIADDPVVIFGATPIKVVEHRVLADSLLQWNRGDWDYFAQKADGTYEDLAVFDDRYDSYIGSRWHRPLYIRPYSAAVAGTGENPTRAVWRHTAKVPGPAVIATCVRNGDRGDGVDVRIAVNDVVLVEHVVSDATWDWQTPVQLEMGDQVEFSIGPNQTSGGDVVALRHKIFADGSDEAVQCP